MHNRGMTQIYLYRKNTDTSSHIDEDKSCSSTNYSDCVGGATTPRRHVRIMTRVIMNMFCRVTYAAAELSLLYPEAEQRGRLEE